MNIYNYFNKLKNAMLISLGITSIIFAFKAFFDFLAFKTSNEIISFKNLSSCLAFFAPLAISFCNNSKLKERLKQQKNMI